MRTALLLLMLRYLGAQDFQQLATNRDGSALYFSAAARMRGSSQYFHRKIFSWDSTNGVRLYAQRASDFPVPAPCCEIIGGVYYHLQAPSVSSDGATVAFTGSIDCDGTSGCSCCAELYQTTISAPAMQPVNVAGAGTLSPNGRYLYLVSSIYYDFAVPHTVTVMELDTGQTTKYSDAPPWPGVGGRHRISNDGSIVLRTASGLSLVNGQVAVSIPASNVVGAPMVNDAGTEVVFSRSAAAAGQALSVYSTMGETIIDLVTQITQSNGALADFGPAMSDDGSQIVFLYGAGRQVYAISNSGQGLRQLTSLPEAVNEVVLSGDGATAFAVTASNRIVRIDVSAGAVTEIVPATPYLSAYDTEISRGAITQASGWGLAGEALEATAPYATLLGGVQVTVGETAAPVTAIAPRAISFAVPWDMPDEIVQIEIDTSSSTSPFVPGFEGVTVAPQSYFGQQSGEAFMQLAAHQDFSSLVSPQNPALPGEILHLYAHDVGPVNPVPLAGVPAPLQPLAMLTSPISCTFEAGADGPVSVSVLFAGLAPQLLNVFQVDVQLPGAFSGSLGGIACQIDAGSGCNSGPLNCGIGGSLNLNASPGQSVAGVVSH